MQHQKMAKCAVCSGPLEIGFAVKFRGLSFVRRDKVRSFAFGDEDLHRHTIVSKFLPVKRARYNPSYLCRACHLYTIDYGITYTKKEAQHIVASTALDVHSDRPKSA